MRHEKDIFSHKDPLSSWKCRGLGWRGHCIGLERGLFLLRTKASQNPVVIPPKRISQASSCFTLLRFPLLPPTFLPPPSSGEQLCTQGKTSWPQKPSLLYAPKNHFPFLQSSSPSSLWPPWSPHCTGSFYRLPSAQHKSRAQREAVVDSILQPQRPHKCQNQKATFLLLFLKCFLLK